MKLVIEGPVATVYAGKKAVLKISTKDDSLTAEVLDIEVFPDVQVVQVAEVVMNEVIGPLVDAYEPAPGILVQREAEPPQADH